MKGKSWPTEFHVELQLGMEFQVGVRLRKKITKKYFLNSTIVLLRKKPAKHKLKEN